MKKIIDFYLIATTLKNKIRRGWIKWNIDKERLESVAEHIYGTCVLAIAIDSEIDLKIDLNKVLKMLILHELEEIIIDDIIPTDDIPAEDKYLSGMKAVETILEGLIKKDEYYKLIDEFNLLKTNESQFAMLCDKLEANLQAKIYSDNNQCDIFSEKNKDMLQSNIIKKLNVNQNSTLFDLFCTNDSVYFKNNGLYEEVINYLKKNNFRGRNE